MLEHIKMLYANLATFKLQFKTKRQQLINFKYNQLTVTFITKKTAFYLERKAKHFFLFH